MTADGITSGNVAAGIARQERRLVQPHGPALAARPAPPPSRPPPRATGSKLFPDSGRAVPALDTRRGRHCHPGSSPSPSSTVSSSTAPATRGSIPEAISRTIEPAAACLASMPLVKLFAPARLPWHPAMPPALREAILARAKAGKGPSAASVHPAHCRPPHHRPATPPPHKHLLATLLRARHPDVDDQPRNRRPGIYQVPARSLKWTTARSISLAS